MTGAGNWIIAEMWWTNNLADPWESVLAGDRIQDGLVTAHDIMLDWRLNADLVTLSAPRA